MKHNWPLILERVILAAIIFLILVILACVAYLGYLHRNAVPVPPETETEPASVPTETTALAQPDFYLPQNLHLGCKLPITVFRDASGSAVDLAELCAGSRVVLMYWGSWCSYCEQQLTHLEEFRSVVEKAGNTRLILINKTDPDKEETIQKAEAYLSRMGWEQEHLYDADLSAYHAFGMRRIPTTIVLDEEGYVRGMVSDVLDSGAALQDLLDQAERGYASSLLSFLERRMTNEKGGLYTAYRSSTESSPSGHDVLSESMGLLMECAVKLNDRALFDRSWRYVSEHMLKDGLAAWYVAEDGSPVDANAMLDDLRIAAALFDAEQVWGGYAGEAQSLAQKLWQNNSYQEQLTSFYDFSIGQSGSSISLAYADLSALDRLARIFPQLAQRREALASVVQNGYISDAFPLYYSSYDYRNQRYSEDSLNTAEALMTLYHLAKAGLLKETSLDWLRNALLTGALAARYNLDGTPVPGYTYESTAVYAIAALIGQTAGDREVYRIALKNMEKTRIADPESPYYGAFSHNEDGTDLASFDQLMPLLVYSEFSNAKFN